MNSRRPVNSDVRRLGVIAMKTLIVILFVCSIAIAQKPAAPHKYGTPISETYMMRPGIYVTVVRDAHGGICGLRISPIAQSGYLLAKRNANEMSYDLLKNVVDELVPLNERGKFVRGGVLNTNCLDVGWANQTCDGNGDVFEYEHVTIFYARSDSKDKKLYAEIRWNRSECVD
jgi:hypothetical protein